MKIYNVNSKHIWDMIKLEKEKDTNWAELKVITNYFKEKKSMLKRLQLVNLKIAETREKENIYLVVRALK